MDPAGGLGAQSSKKGRVRPRELGDGRGNLCCSGEGMAGENFATGRLGRRGCAAHGSAPGRGGAGRRPRALRPQPAEVGGRGRWRLPVPGRRDPGRGPPAAGAARALSQGLAPVASRLAEPASPPPEPPRVLEAGLRAAARAGTGRGASGSGTPGQVRAGGSAPGGARRGARPRGVWPRPRGAAAARARARRRGGCAEGCAAASRRALRCCSGGLTFTPGALGGGLWARPGARVELLGAGKREPRRRRERGGGGRGGRPG